MHDNPTKGIVAHLFTESFYHFQPPILRDRNEKICYLPSMLKRYLNSILSMERIFHKPESGTKTGWISPII